MVAQYTIVPDVSAPLSTSGGRIRHVQRILVPNAYNIGSDVARATDVFTLVWDQLSLMRAPIDVHPLATSPLKSISGSGEAGKYCVSVSLSAQCYCQHPGVINHRSSRSSLICHLHRASSWHSSWI